MSKNSKIMWVFGSSASGKETLINRLISNELHDLKDNIGLSSHRLVACQESIDWIAQYDGDPIGEKRKEIPEIVKAKIDELGDETAILIKGQTLDLQNNSLRILKDMLPHYSHVILYILGDVNELYARVKNKSWYTKDIDFNTVKSWAEGDKSDIEKYNNEFDVLYLDGRNGAHFEILNANSEGLT